MSKQAEQASPPDSDVKEKLQEANSVLNELNHYQDVAGAVDDHFERENEHRSLALDDLPYGEELIRTRNSTESVEFAIEQLEQIESGAISGAEAAKAFDEAVDTIEEARATLEDCKDLPDDDDEDN